MDSSDNLGALICAEAHTSLDAPSSSSAAVWQHMVQDMRIGISVAASRKRLVFVNSAMAALFGYTTQAMLAVPPLQLVARQDRRAVIGHIRQRLAGLPCGPVEIRGRHRDGHVFDGQLSSCKVQYGGESAVLLTLSDISDLKDEIQAAQREAGPLAQAEELALMGSSEMEDGRKEVRYSRGMFRLLGATSEELRPNGDWFLQHVPAEDRLLVLSLFEGVRSGQPHCTRAIVQDITHQTEASRALMLSQFMIDRASIMILRLDVEGRIRYVNETAGTVLRCDREQLCSMTIFDIAPHRGPEEWTAAVAALKQAGGKLMESDWRALDGKVVPVEITANYLEYDGAGYVVVYAKDITSRRDAEQRAYRLAHFDQLTGLPNRSQLQERLGSEAQRARRESRRIALLAVQIGQVNVVNETLGLDAGDELVKTVAQRLSVCLKDADLVVHLGHGDFAVMLARGTDAGEDVSLPQAQIIADGLSGPIAIKGTDIYVTCDIGIAIFPQDSEQPDHLLGQAQAAMRIANAQGGTNNICFYTSEANARASLRINMAAALRRAIEREELSLQYQPQVDLTTGRVIGVEALLRWKNSAGDNIPPGDFIPLAEETGLMLPIGEWVLRTACRAAARWQKAGLAPIRMNVNLSALQLRQPDIAHRIEAILLDSGLAPHCLGVEVTESMLMDNFDHVSRTLEDLKAIGVEIALDDFGTGYSNLSNLRRLPIDVVKVDRSFVPDVTAAIKDVSITRAVITMAHSLQMKVLAEGVETKGQLALLVANQCDQIQGFYFSPPLSADDVATLLSEDRCVPEDLLGRKARKRTLLLVDDEENIVSSLRRLLRKDGYHIVTANSGPQGLQRLAEYEVDVIVSDQRMPGMTGVEFLRRAKELYPETVRLVLSGYTELQSITDAINEGAIYKFLTKPWDDERVRVHIQEAFHHKEMADENRRLDREVQDANRELAEVNDRLQRLLETQREQIHRDETSLVIAHEVLENIPAPVIGFDVEGMIAFVNPDAESLFKPTTGLLGSHAEDALNPDLLSIWQDSDGAYHSVELCGRAYQAACRPMAGDARSQGKLMVLTPAPHQTPL